MKLSRRKMELMLVDIAVIICVYYMTNLVKVLRLHSIVLNGEINLARMLDLVVTIMAGRIVFGVYRCASDRGYGHPAGDAAVPLLLPTAVRLSQ